MRNPDLETSEKISFIKLKRMYLFAFISIAVAVILSQILIQYNLNKQQNDSRIINTSGKQRMLSQKITKGILKLNFVTDSLQKQQQIAIIHDNLEEWNFNQLALEHGNDSLGLSEIKSSEISNLYQSIKPNFDSFYKASTLFLNLSKNNNKDAKANDLLEIILKNESIFLEKMDHIVDQYEIEATAKVNLQRKTEYIILGITLLILFLEFVFIFTPTNSKIEKLISNLFSSERKAIKLAHDTEVLSEEKEDTVKELKSLYYALEDTLLYCRVTPKGNIIHIGEKFSKLIQYNPFSTAKTFAQVLTPIEKEQLIIDEIITSKSRRGWQGEINISDNNQKTIWLDLSIVPVTIKKDESELLIICFDITERKFAEQEVERLNKENIETKINHQKVISSKIVENQENEQNRIAREIHDGIGQMLTGLKFSLESINLDDKEKATQKVEYLKQLSLDIIKGVRTATFNLMPPELSDHGINSALSKLTHELSKLTGKNILFFNKTDFDKRLESLVEINIYRLTQEAINNAIKYAESSHIIVQLSHSDNILSIIIDDNGKGFEVSEVEKRRNSESGMGLLFMNERVQYINGRVFINSILGEGTRITFNIPI